MKAIILNTDSILSPGDAGIFLAQVRLLRKIFPGLSLSATSRTPRLDRAFYALLDVSVLEPLVPAPSIWRGAGRKALRGAAHLLNPAPKNRLLHAVRASDFAVSTGGGPFFSNRRSFPGLTFYQNILHVRLAQALGKPVLFFPQSFGPFLSTAARRSVLRLLENPRTARIFVREPFSGEWLLSRLPSRVRGKVEACPDMAFRLDPPRAGTDDACLAGLPRPRLALTVRDWDYPDAATPAERRELKDRYLPAVRDAALEFASRRGGGVAVVAHTRGPGDFENDRLVSRRLWALLGRVLPGERLRYIDLPDDTPPGRFLDLYASADVVLATRMHSALFALLAGTAVVSIHYQPKGPGIMNMLGLGEYSLPISRPDPAALAAALESALERLPGLRALLAERIAGLRTEIEVKIRSALAEVV